MRSARPRRDACRLHDGRSAREISRNLGPLRAAHCCRVEVDGERIRHRRSAVVGAKTRSEVAARMGRREGQHGGRGDESENDRNTTIIIIKMELKQL